MGTLKLAGSIPMWCNKHPPFNPLSVRSATFYRGLGRVKEHEREKRGTTFIENWP